MLRIVVLLVSILPSGLKAGCSVSLKAFVLDRWHQQVAQIIISSVQKITFLSSMHSIPFFIDEQER
jgi:hypothetical protein